MVDAISSTNASTAQVVADKSSMAMSTEDFMKIMITELTNQDPFEPMKNQELLNQMATLQQIESNDKLNKANLTMVESFQTLMASQQTLMGQQSLSTATSMIGQLLSGTDTDGNSVVGRVTAVSMLDGNVMLEMDTGQRIPYNQITRLGGSSTQDIIGDIAIGESINGTDVVGRIESVEIDGSEIKLHLKVAGQEELAMAKLSKVSILNEDTADLLVGTNAEAGVVKGLITSIRWSTDDVLVNIQTPDDGMQTVPISELTKISAPSTATVTE
ncbi:MAG: hypothetical protein JEZ07_07585 [Phycisphaerae bacterium]|nr:hypothetical protein [Phycisphaerae bacterium]